MSSRLPLSRRHSLQLLGAWVASKTLMPALAAEREAIDGIEARIDRLALDAPLKMQFHGSTPAEARAWQQQFRAKLLQLLGPIEPPANWETIVEAEVDCGDHVRRELVLQAAGLEPLPVHLLVPKNVTGKLPGLLALHGHGNFGHDPVAGVDDRPEVRRAIDSSNYDYGRQFVRRGYAVVCPCFTPFGSRRKDKGDNDICGVTAIRLQFLGRSLIGENLRDARWALNALLQLAPVDPQRLGCIGLSLGGRMTTLVAAVDERIRVAVVSGALNCFQERISTPYSAGCQLIPGILEFGDIPEIAGLIAPRPLLFETGLKDGLIKPEWVDVAWKRILGVYDAFGVKERLAIDRFDGGHRWNGGLAVEVIRCATAPF